MPDGVRDLLRDLRAAGLRLGLVSDYRGVPDRLTALSLPHDAFDFVLVTEEHGAMKPARRMIDAGNVEGALGEVSRMPGAADAMSWIDAAKRYVEARRALNQLELAALNGGGPTPAGPASLAICCTNCSAFSASGLLSTTV